MRLASIALAFAFLFLTSAVTAQAKSNGWNTNFVRFNGGTFERTHTGAWLEFKDGNNRPRYQWRETHRDDWSIYFRDNSRNMTMQIDMYRNWIRLEWPGHPMQDQWRITEADSRINGRLVTEIRTNAGNSLRMGRGGRWTEYNSRGVPEFYFRETHRDQWSVYLRDDSRNMKMQIDVHRNWVRLEWPGHPMQDQWPIIGSR